mgnify:CR=1 FL=1
MAANELQTSRSQEETLSHDSLTSSSASLDKQTSCGTGHDGASHNHHHSSGTCCLKFHSPRQGSWLNDLGETTESQSRDIERGPPHFQRVVLLIDGLQCGCCEGGISRTVERISAIRNHQVNIVLARLEFELDMNRLSVVDVIKRLNAKTGYTFEEQAAPPGQVLELVTSGASAVQDAGTPFGVTQVEFMSEEQPWQASLTLSGRHSKQALRVRTPLWARALRGPVGSTRRVFHSCAAFQ